MTSTQSADPLALPEGPDPLAMPHTPGEPPPEIKRDQYGRYLLPHPDTGKLQAWTRATTFANSVADTYNIMLYQNRLTAKGMSIRPDLYAEAAATHIDDKRTLNRIAEIAQEAAGKSAKSRLGTAVHAFTEQVDRGDQVAIPEPWNKDVQAYVEKLRAEKIEILPQYIEATVIAPSLGVAGTLDRIGTRSDWAKPRICDLKTGHNVAYAWIEIACQLYVYSKATHYYDHRTETLHEMPEVDTDKALVMWLPVGEARCELFDIDLKLGGRVASVCTVVRDLRSLKGYSTPFNGQTVEAAVDEWESQPTGVTTTTDDEWDSEPTAPAKKAESAKTDEKKATAGGGTPYKLDPDNLPEGLKPEGNRFQIVKLAKQSYLIVDVVDMRAEEFRLRRDAKARQTEWEDALVSPDATAPTGEAPADDEWDEQAAGEPPAPVTAEQAAETTSPEPSAPASGTTDDDWGDEPTTTEDAAPEPAERSETERRRDELARLKGEEKDTSKRKWMAEVLEATSYEQLARLYGEASKLGEWTELLTKAAKRRKEELLAAATEMAPDDDNW